MRVADFFCGGGGFSEGFRQAGFNIVFAVDKWEPAITTYKGNKPGVNAILDDVIRISNLPDDEFERRIRCLRHKGCLIIELSRKYNHAFTIQSNPFPCALAMKTHILSV